MTAAKKPVKAPFPYFGGKRDVAAEVWRRFGDVPAYVEPFFGSGAVLFGRPHNEPQMETVNDADGMLANFWRAVRADPETVAYHADWPVNENDLHARHARLVAQKNSLQERLEGDPEFCDPLTAGWWVWGLCAWIGNGWCGKKGPWRVVEGKLAKSDAESDAEGDAEGDVGISRRRPHLGDSGRGVHRPTQDIYSWFDALCDRLRRVRVCCGDWQRVMGDSILHRASPCGVFLDPPYADTAGRDGDLYACDSLTVAHDVREWAIAHGDDRRLRIALCGYDGEHEMPDSWSVYEWQANGGFGNQGKGRGKANKSRERIWFSPHCLRPARGLFDSLIEAGRGVKEAVS